MSRKQLLTRWCRLSKESIVHIVTDDLQYQIANTTLFSITQTYMNISTGKY